MSIEISRLPPATSEGDIQSYKQLESIVTSLEPAQPEPNKRYNWKLIGIGVLFLILILASKWVLDYKQKFKFLQPLQIKYVYVLFVLLMVYLGKDA